MLKMNPGYSATFFDDHVWSNFIPKDHPLVKIRAFIKLDFLEELVKDSYSNENPAGRDPIDPRTLFLICLLEFIEGLSDGQAVAKVYETPVHRWFVGLSTEDKVPDDTTISFFRVQRMGEKKFKTAFQQIIRQLHEAGLIDGQIQSQDATDMRADIALMNVFQLINKGRLNLLRAIRKVNQRKYEKLLAKSNVEIQRNPANKQKHFEELIAAAGLVYDAVRRGSSLINNIEVCREMETLGRILEERKDECFDNEGKKQLKEDEKKIIGKMINPSDPDASWGAKSDKKFFAGYKAEVNTDHKYGLITEIEVSKAGHPEEKSAAPLLGQQKDNLGIVPNHFTADAKYDFGNTRTELKALGIPNIYIPLVSTKNKEGGLVWDNFYFESGHLFCPAGYPAESRFNDEKRLGFEFKFNAEVCQTCEQRPECTKAKYGRSVFVSHTQLERQSALAFNVTDEYELIYKGQHWKVEPGNAALKRYNGLNRARYRTLPRIRIQAFLSALAANLKKFVKVIMGKLKEGVTVTLAKLTALSPPKGVAYSDAG